MATMMRSITCWIAIEMRSVAWSACGWISGFVSASM